MAASEVSIIVCTRDCEGRIAQVLASCRREKPLELIVVDGRSSDATARIAAGLADRVLEDPGRGLALARSIGMKAARGRFLFFVGSDNVLEPGAVGRLLACLEKGGHAGVAPLTRIPAEASGYWASGLRARYRSRFSPGPRRVIGSPMLYRREALERHVFDPSMSWSDDTDLCERLAADGLTVAYCEAFCDEIGSEAWADFSRRFRLYGLSDFEFYRKYSPGWGLRRKISSWLHPWDAELIQPWRGLRPWERLYFLPFLLTAALLRCRGWALAALGKR